MAEKKRPASEPEEESFAEILSQFERQQAAAEPPAARRGGGRAGRRGTPQQVHRGTVAGVSGDYVLVGYGAKSEGLIPIADLRDAQGHLTVQPGDSFDVTITGRNPEGFVVLSRVTGPRPRDWEALEEASENQEIIAGRVTGTTKGGLTVDVGARAFLPASRSGARDAAEMAKLVGQEIRCRIIQFDREDENIIVDRRAVLEEEARIVREAALAGLEEGAVVRSTVRSLMEYGAFVDAGGVDGLLHVTDMSWSRTSDPRSELQVGDVLDLKVLKLDRDTGKISLGLKQMYPDPWEEAVRQVNIGDRARGTVTRLTDFGAFVEIRPGVEGMIHVSEMSWTKRVRKPSDLLRRGEEVEAVVLRVEPEARRIALGLKQVLGNPWDTIEERYPAGRLIEGKVVRLAKFGAFVEVEEGVDGLIHVSDLSNEKRIEHPSEVLKVGNTVKAVVLSAEREKRRLKLGVKQLEATTLDEFLLEHQAGDRVMGRVVRVEGDQATVQLGEGVEGICRMGPGAASPEALGTLGAALAAAFKGKLPETPRPPAEPLREGQLRSFVIERVDSANRRIELNMS